MFTPSNELKSSVENSNVVRIKTNIVEEIKKDPLFKTNNFYDAVKYAEENGISLKELYKLMDVEEKDIAEKEHWDKTYFYKKVNWLNQNFAVDERIPHIKEVGRFVFGKETKERRESVNPNPALNRNCQSRKKNTISMKKVIGITAAVAAIFGVIVWLIKILK